MVDGTLLAAGLLQAAILALFVVAVRRGNVAAGVNAAGAFALAVAPLGLRAAIASPAPAWTTLTLWLAVAGLLHCVGMLGVYESRVWWWDHLTHTVSAALLAAVLYAALLVAPPSVPGVAGGLGAADATVAATVAVGVFWELIELGAREVGERFDVEPVLVHYGWRDTGYDLVFDAVGAVAVVALDLRVFVPIAARAPDTTAAVLAVTGWVVLLGSVLLGAVVYRQRSWRV